MSTKQVNHFAQSWPVTKNYLNSNCAGFINFYFEELKCDVWVKCYLS